MTKIFNVTYSFKARGPRQSAVIVTNYPDSAEPQWQPVYEAMSKQLGLACGCIYLQVSHSGCEPGATRKGDSHFESDGRRRNDP